MSNEKENENGMKQLLILSRSDIISFSFSHSAIRKASHSSFSVSYIKKIHLKYQIICLKYTSKSGNYLISIDLYIYVPTPPSQLHSIQPPIHT